MKRSPLRKVSKKREKLNREYSKLREEFLASHPICQWWLAESGWTQHIAAEDNDAEAYEGPYYTASARFLAVQLRSPISCDIHHKRGRGRFLLDTSTWMAVSREGHNWIHAHPKESYEKGYMLPR